LPHPFFLTVVCLSDLIAGINGKESFGIGVGRGVQILIQIPLILSKVIEDKEKIAKI